MDRKCKNSPDSYCYICGSVTLKRCKRQLSPHVINFMNCTLDAKLVIKTNNGHLMYVVLVAQVRCQHGTKAPVLD